MTTAEYITLNYVTAMWVAEYYGVSRQRVYYAISRGKFKGCAKVTGPRGGYDVWVMDRTKLPPVFPR